MRGLWIRNLLSWLFREWSYLLPLGLIVGFTFSYIIYELFQLGLAGSIRDIATSLKEAVKHDDHEAVRSYAYSFGGTIAGLAILASIPFQFIRIWINERTAKTAEEGHITDRLSKAMEQLGATKVVKVRRRVVSERLTKYGESEKERAPTDEFSDSAHELWETVEQTVPNLEVRLGALYAMERIALDSQRDHIPIMQALCAYVRVNAPAADNSSYEADWQKPALFDYGSSAVTEKEKSDIFMKLERWIEVLDMARVDVQVALDIIGRRPNHRINHERRQKTSFFGNRTFYLNLSNTNLRKVNLYKANMEGCLLRDSLLEGANLSEANLNNTYLFRAHLEGAYFGGATIAGADIKEANLLDWSESVRRFRSNLYVGKNNLTQKQLDSSIGDDMTVLPLHLKRPAW